MPTPAVVGAFGALDSGVVADFSSTIAERGWAVTTSIIDERGIDALREAVAGLAVNGRGGARNLLADPRIRALAAAPTLRALAASVLGPDCFAVRALLFDKTADANWKVVWHQDLTIAVQARVDVDGFGPWTEKAGVVHGQPPAAILEQMLALRVHLDPCGSANGPVRVIDGTHTLGRLSANAITELRAKRGERECLAEAGGVLAFRPLILHASAAAREPGHRRVIHIEYASCSLPAPLEWQDRVA